MKKTILTLTLATSLVGLSSVAHADLDSFLRSVNNQALSDITNFNNKLGRQFGVPVANVDVIVKSVPKPADAFMIFQLSQMAHVEPAVVLQKYQRSQGKGWGVLAQELGIKPGSPEFHALKRGNLSFTGVRSGDAVQQSGSGPGSGRGRDQGRGQGHGKGKGRGRD